MVDIILTIAVFVLLVLCAAYVVIEVINRKQRKQDENILESNLDVRVAIGAWVFGTAVIIGFTIAHYVVDPDHYTYIACCGLGVIALAIAYFFAFNKIIINKETGDMVAYGIIRKKKFNVKDITLLKHNTTAWTAYSNVKRLFHISDKHHEYENAFYYYIRKESKCEEKHPKGSVGRDIEE